MVNENRIACVKYRKSYRRRPLIHLAEVNYRDVPVGKTYCGRKINTMNYAVYEENEDVKPTCESCIQKQKRLHN